jgi:hypothetical protein
VDIKTAEAQTVSKPEHRFEFEDKALDSFIPYGLPEEWSYPLRRLNEESIALLVVTVESASRTRGLH